MLGELLLFLGELAGFGAELAHLVGELVGSIFAVIFLKLLELFFSAAARCEGGGDGLLVESFAGLVEIGARFVELLFGASALLRIGFSDALLDVVEISEDIAFFFAEAFELAFDIVAFFGGASFGESGLEFLEAFVEVLLALGQFFQAIEHFELFALGSGLGREGLAFGFVFVVAGFEFELIELALGAGISGGTAGSAAIALLGDLVFARAHFQEGLESRLFLGESSGQRF